MRSWGLNGLAKHGSLVTDKGKGKLIATCYHGPMGKDETDILD